jgi:hypothetical protein
MIYLLSARTIGNLQIHEQQRFSPRVWHSVSLL